MLVDEWVSVILEAGGVGARVRNLGDVWWLFIEDGKPGNIGAGTSD